MELKSSHGKLKWKYFFVKAPNNCPLNWMMTLVKFKQKRLLIFYSFKSVLHHNLSLKAGIIYYQSVAGTGVARVLKFAIRRLQPSPRNYWAEERHLQRMLSQRSPYLSTTTPIPTLFLNLFPNCQLQVGFKNFSDCSETFFQISIISKAFKLEIQGLGWMCQFWIKVL